MTFERRNPFDTFEDWKMPPGPKDVAKSGDKLAASLAARIIFAGKKRRNEVVEDLRPPAGSLGRAILDAAAKARGEDVK
jgi:hypothetical protein